MISPSVRVRIALLIFAGVLCLLAVMPLNLAHGGSPLTFVVNDSGDGAPGACDAANCTLREAIIAANNNPFADTITFDLNVFPPNGVILYPNTQMDFIDARDGITIDATGTLFGLQKCALCNFNFGFVFYSPSGMPAKNIVVRNLIANDFNYDGIQVCGGLDVGLSDCISDVSGVDIKNTTFADNNNDGLRILGDHVSNVTLNGLKSTSNGASGIDITAKSTLTGLTVTGGNATQNGDMGLRTHGGTTSAINISSFTASTNTGVGIGLSTTAASMFDVDITDVTASGNDATGISVTAAGALHEVSVSGSTTEDNDTGHGIFLSGGPALANITVSGNHSRRNLFGVGLVSGVASTGVHIEGNDVMGNVYTGILLSYLGSGGSGNFIRENTVSGNGDGISLAGNDPPTINSFTVTISRNSTHDNTKLGINLVPQGGDPLSGVTPNDPGDTDQGVNGLLNFPEWFVLVGYTEAEGTACANCLVEVFLSDNDPSGYGEGKEFLLERTADANGRFSIDLCEIKLAAGTLLTATATDQTGKTSEFSENYTVLETSGCPTATPSPSPTATPSPTVTPSPSPTPAPGPHKQGDLNCDGKIDGLDALLAILFKFGLSITATGDCNIGEGSPKFGDVNCSGAVDEGDALAILAYVAKVTALPQQAGCKLIGQVLPS